MHPSRPDTLFMQKHWDVMRTDDGGEHWREISGNLPTDFGFVVDVHAHEPETVYVVPITSDYLHFPLDGKLRVYRSRTGGDEWEPLTRGLPQEHCYVNVLRDAMAVDTLDECGIYFGTTGGQVYASPDAGDTLGPDRARPAGGAVGGGADAAMTSTAVVLPAHLRASAGWTARWCSTSTARSPSASVLDALEARYPMLRGTIRDHGTRRGARSCGSSPARRTCRTSRRTRRCPTRSRRAPNRCWSSARWPAAEPGRSGPRTARGPPSGGVCPFLSGVAPSIRTLSRAPWPRAEGATG